MSPGDWLFLVSAIVLFIAVDLKLMSGDFDRRFGDALRRNEKLRDELRSRQNSHWSGASQTNVVQFIRKS